MQLPILALTPVTRAVCGALLLVSRGTLLLLALYHVPMVVPSLYHVFELPPLSPFEVERIMLVFFVLPEAAARILCRGLAATRLSNGRASSHPLVHYAGARARCRLWLDRPLVKFVVYPLVPAVVLFRLRQVITYGGVLGEYHEFGLQAYLLGFGLYWLLSAMYLLLFAAALRAIAETIALPATWALPGWALTIRRIVEIADRLVYYLAPPILMFVRLVLH